MRRIAALCYAVVLTGCATTTYQASNAPAGLHRADDLALRAIDDRVRRAVLSGDASAMEALTHPGYRVNAPNNLVLTRDQVLGMIRSGAIAADRFDRTIEAVSVAGDVSIVMGRETVEAPASSETGGLFGTGTLNRRFTNIYLRSGPNWLFVARHANVAPAVRRDKP